VAESLQNDKREQERADLWRDFHDRFMLLAREEEQVERAASKDRLLRAYCDYKKHPEIWAEKGKPGQGSFCLLKAPETGLWIVSDGVSENFQARFRALAARAGVALGCAKDTEAEDSWLHRLYLDLLENNSDQLFAASREGGVILRVCVASATFCSRLERKALQDSEPGSRPEQRNSDGAHPLLTGTKQPEPPPLERNKKATQKAAANGNSLAESVESKSTNAAAGQFTHSEDYRSVTVRGKPFSLTSRQAQMIEILRDAHANGNPDISIASILERLETPNARWQDTFRSNPNARKALIRTGPHKGTLRLNL
jgi:hypothetical protein